jgi:hypothetical protein
LLFKEQLLSQQLLLWHCSHTLKNILPAHHFFNTVCKNDTRSNFLMLVAP